jgi:DNA-binding MarR family transcriptional regulator
MEITDILVKIRKIIRSINLESKKIQKEFGISIPQLLCLNYLKTRTTFTATQHEIKGFLNLNASTVSGIITRLEKKGFIARLPKSGDKRVTTIALTTRGNDLLDTVPVLLHDRLSQKLSSYPESNVLEVEKALNLLIALFEIEDVEASPVIAVEDELDPSG